MRLLCDANLGSRIALALASSGYDVVRSIHVLGQAAPDDEILAFAVAQGRVLLTCDSDFGELVFLKGKTPPPGILYVRFEPQSVDDIVPRIVAALNSGRVEGNMIVIGDAGDRVTTFPRQG